MLSRKFATDLEPDPPLRRLLLLSGAAASLAGVAIALHLEAPVALRIVALILWLCHSIRELYRLSVGMHRVRRIRIWQSGDAAAMGDQGKELALELRPGSVVLPAIAWLRFRFPDGLDYGELLRCNRGNETQWHRLQLIWRQRHANFGRVRGS